MNPENIVLGGDFNTIMESQDIKGGASNTHKKVTAYLNEYADTYALVDVWRIFNKNSFRYTWSRSKPHIIMERIDYFLLSFQLTQTVRYTDIIPSYMSDHAIPIVKIRVAEVPPRGPGYWKLNNSLLELPEFEQELDQIIAQLTTNTKDKSNSKLKWETMKMLVRGFAIKLGARKKKTIQNQINALEKKLKDIEQEQAKSIMLFNDSEQQRVLIKKDLNDLYNQKIEGVILRSRCTTYELFEKPTSYFYKLEKVKARRKVITSLKLDNDELIENEEYILEALHKYYSSLYKEKPCVLDPEYFNDITVPTVREEDYEMLVAPISQEEIKIAIKQLNKGKCPGLDGLTTEFYDTYYNKVKHMLHSMYKEVEQTLELPSSARQGAIVLMEKLHRSPLKIKNWRPLSMLSIDYKIYAKIIANRMEYVLTYLISDDQKAYMKGRHISENLLELSAVIDYCEKTATEAILLVVDIEKAFDSLNWTAMKKILAEYGFPQRFIDLLFVCFKGFQVEVMNNGHSTEKLYFERATKQGCPVSGAVFNLVIEVLSMKLKQNSTIQPVEINGIKKMLSQFADNLWTATKFSKESLEEQIRIFNKFYAYTGLKVSYDKTEIMRIGSLAHTNAKMLTTLPIKWSDGPVTILGVKWYPNMQQTTICNYEEVLQKIMSIFKVWSARNLSLMGKVLIVNTFAVSQFLYKLQCLPKPNEQIVNRFKMLVNEFIWTGKRPKISIDRLEKEWERGGVKLCNIDLKNQSLKFASFIKYMKNDSTTVISTMLEKIIKVPNTQLINSNISAKDAKQRIKKTEGLEFLKEAFIVWCKIKFTTPLTKLDIYKQPIWYNSHIRIANKLVNHNKDVMEKIKTVEDMFNKVTKEPYKYQNLKTLLNLPNSYSFLDHMSILAAIPTEWKKIIKKDTSEQITVIPLVNEQKSKNKKMSKLAYEILLSKESSRDSYFRHKWEQKLGIEISDEIWRNSMNKTKKLTMCTKLRSFQYRLLNNAIITSIDLKRFGLTDSEMCAFCNTTPESILHLIAQCQIVKQKIWKPLSRWLYHFCNIQFEYEPYEIVLNDYKDSFQDMVNTIILVTKQYVYATKCLKAELNFAELISKISTYYKLEGITAKRNQQIKRFRQKWHMYFVV